MKWFNRFLLFKIMCFLKEYRKFANMLLKDFNTYLDKIDSDFWSRLCREEGELRKYKKGEEFITINKVARYIGLIKSGSVKYVAYNSEMDEKIVGLETVNGYAASWPFCLHGIPSIVSIIANSDLEIYCLSVSKIIEFAKSDLDFERKIAQANEQLFFTAYERLVDFYIQSPKERYDALLQKCPEVFNVFDLKDIASFLNITPQHLSRLRKDVLKNIKTGGGKLTKHLLSRKIKIISKFAASN